MANSKDKKITIEKTHDKVILKVDDMQLSMSPTLARELGDRLYKCGCDVAATAGS